MINYVLQNELYHKEYVEYATNAGLVVRADYKFEDGPTAAPGPAARGFTAPYG